MTDDSIMMHFAVRLSRQISWLLLAGSALCDPNYWVIDLVLIYLRARDGSVVDSIGSDAAARCAYHAGGIGIVYCSEGMN